MQEISFDKTNDFKYLVQPLKGTVIKSQHDRVGIVTGSGGGESSVNSRFGYFSTDFRFSFSISTSIDIRHEFWIKTEDGKEVQIVLPFYASLKEGQDVCISSISIKAKNEVIPILFALKNNASQTSHFYFINESGCEEVSSEELAAIRIRDETPLRIDKVCGKLTFINTCAASVGEKTSIGEMSNFVMLIVFILSGSIGWLVGSMTNGWIGLGGGVVAAGTFTHYCEKILGIKINSTTDEEVFAKKLKDMGHRTIGNSPARTLSVVF